MEEIYSSQPVERIYSSQPVEEIYNTHPNLWKAFTIIISTCGRNLLIQTCGRNLLILTRGRYSIYSSQPVEGINSSQPVEGICSTQPVEGSIATILRDGSSHPILSHPSLKMGAWQQRNTPQGTSHPPLPSEEGMVTWYKHVTGTCHNQNGVVARLTGRPHTIPSPLCQGGGGEGGRGILLREDEFEFCKHTDYWHSCIATVHKFGDKALLLKRWIDCQSWAHATTVATSCRLSQYR